MLDTNTWDCGTPKSANNAFSILTEPRAIPNSKTAPKKRGPKRTKIEWAVISMETSAQRKERQAAERQAAMGKILRKNAYSEVGLSTRGAGDRAASIRKTAI